MQKNIWMRKLHNELIQIKLLQTCFRRKQIQSLCRVSSCFSRKWLSQIDGIFWRRKQDITTWLGIPNIYCQKNVFNANSQHGKIQNYRCVGNLLPKQVSFLLHICLLLNIRIMNILIVQYLIWGKTYTNSLVYFLQLHIMFNLW